MIKSALILSAAALIAGVGAVNAADARPVRHATQGELASKAQLAREHARAVKAGDTANDPYSSASSDALNQQQLAQAQAVMGANSAAATDVQPGAIGAANTSSADANTGAMNTGAATNTGSTMGNDTMGATNGSNVVPPQSPPVTGTTPDTQNTPQSGTSNDSSNSPSGTTSPQ